MHLPASSPLIVAGMHRSGTSLMASLLSSLSVNMGPQLLAPDPHNVRGYFEDVEFQTLQRRMLSACCAPDDGGHLDWGFTEHETLDRDQLPPFVPEAQALLASRSDRATPWGWKDPRTSLLLDFWDPLVDQARYVFVYRFPWDVADSMQRLGAAVFLKNPEYAYRIWAFYNRHIRDFYAAHPDRCLLVSSNALPAHLEAFMRALRDKLGIQIRDAVPEGFYADDLFRTTGDADPLIDLVAAFWPECTRLLSELDDLADLTGRDRWRVGPVRTRLARPDSEPDGRPVDVSVVIPCYEQGTLLVEAIASVERSAPPNCELIIVNDGSRQARTLEILDGLKRFGYFIHDQENLGLAGARNAGIGLARGRYILPLDDDNRIRDHYLEDAIRVLDARPEVGVVYGERFEFGIPRAPQAIPDFDLRSLLRRNYIDACAVLRKQVWIDCRGYDPWIFGLEDWELWIHAAERGWQFHHLPYIAFDYRVRPDSLLSRAVAIEGELRRRIREKHAELFWKTSHEHAEELSRRLAEQADTHERELRALTAEVTAARDEASVLREAIARCTAEIERMKGSWGWRLLTLGDRLDRR
jgi:hypothetical protein